MGKVSAGKARPAPTPAAGGPSAHEEMASLSVNQSVVPHFWQGWETDPVAGWAVGGGISVSQGRGRVGRGWRTGWSGGDDVRFPAPRWGWEYLEWGRVRMAGN